jgi:hypothetical protein
MKGRIALVCLAFGGCVFSGDDSGGGPYVAVTDIAHQYDVAMCSHLVACHEISDQATCLATNIPSSFYVDPAAAQGVLAGKIRYNGSLVAQCFAQLAASTCNPGDLANRRPVDQCMLYAFTGLGTNGATCTTNEECGSGQCNTTCQQGQQQCCLGTCFGDALPPAAPLQLGAHCPQGTGTYDPCAVGAYCDNATSTCTAVKPAGSQCQNTKECGDGLQCDVFTTLTCVEAPHADQPCTSSGRCGDEGLYCGNDHVCHYVALAGEACGTGQQCSNFYTTCNPSSQTCTTYPKLGEDCSVYQRCNDLGTYCDGSVCRTPKAMGQPCHTDTECASLYCDTGTTLTCTAPPTCPL